MPKPLAEVTQNCADFTQVPMIVPTGFREYDARWRYPEQINLIGMKALGLGLGTQLHEMGLKPAIAVGCDYRSYSPAIKEALTVGLLAAGCEVHDIGLALSPMAYFSQFALDVPAVAQVTASHNPNGWTGVKIGAERPLTHGPKEMGRLKEIVLGGQWIARGGGSYHWHGDIRERYLADVAGDTKLTRKLRVVCATGNGTAGAFAPALLEAIGAEVIPLHCELDYTFPHHNPNPEAMEMLHAIRDCVLEHKADIGLGFDGDGDRCGVVDNEGEEIFADKMGVILARDLVKSFPGAQFVVDVKSTGLFNADPLLQEAGAKTDYWKTGHSHMKRRVKEIAALVGFEKSGHYFFAEPLGKGYDDGLVVAREVCQLLDRNPGQSMADLRRALPQSWSTPTMSPACADEEKYGVVERAVAALQDLAAKGTPFAGKKIKEVITVNGARIQLEGGGWGLIRASSNTPNLVVVCESFESEADMRAIFEAVDGVLQGFPEVGAYDQTI
ncbi:MAG: phosphomannomutase/phosphoglucomutase [Pseudomonadota bacterium]